MSAAVCTAVSGCAQARVVITEGERFDPPPVVQQAPPIPSLPPAPQVWLVQVRLASASDLSERATERLIASLSGTYLTFSAPPTEVPSFAGCDVDDETARQCVVDRLLEARARPGTVALVASETPDGALRWQCIGAGRGAFLAERQSVQWAGVLKGPDRSWTPEELSTASACLTYAGRQSGW